MFHVKLFEIETYEISFKNDLKDFNVNHFAQYSNLSFEI